MSRRAAVLITFGGRRDRMALLKSYVGEAMRLGIIDEWHVWNFARTPQDADWLSTSFPAIRRTSNDRIYRYVSHARVPVQGAQAICFDVRANHDAHLALIAEGSGPSYELIMGGWGNSAVALREWPTGVPIDHARPQPAPKLVCAAPALLSARAWRSVEVHTTRERGHLVLALQVDGRHILRFKATEEAPTPFRVAVMTGYGGEADWRFADDKSSQAGLFYASLNNRRHRWNPVYEYYSSRADEYADTVFLKCDDDIVYIDLDRMPEFIHFRRERPEYFLVSASVVNNGVCAYVQQQVGLIPKELMTLEMPPGGFRGFLWESGAKAEALHRYFLRDPSRFRSVPRRAFIPPARLSINFVSWLGADLRYFEIEFSDDEQDLSVTLPRFLGRENAIYLPFVVAHLSFGPHQDPTMNIEGILDGYRALAASLGVLEGNSPSPCWRGEGTNRRQSG